MKIECWLWWIAGCLDFFCLVLINQCKKKVLSQQKGNVWYSLNSIRKIQFILQRIHLKKNIYIIGKNKNLPWKCWRVICQFPALFNIYGKVACAFVNTLRKDTKWNISIGGGPSCAWNKFVLLYIICEKLFRSLYSLALFVYACNLNKHSFLDFSHSARSDRLTFQLFLVTLWLCI